MPRKISLKIVTNWLKQGTYPLFTFALLAEFGARLSDQRHYEYFPIRSRFYILYLV